MAKIITAIFLFLGINFHIVSCYNNLEKIKLLAEISNADNLMESIDQNSGEMSLCQKHSQIYLDERGNLTGWAFRSNIF